IDLVPYPYVNGTRTVNSTALANCKIMSESTKIGYSKGNVPAEIDSKSLSIKIFDSGAAAWSILKAGRPYNYRLHLIKWVNDGSGYIREFYGVIDKVAVKRETATVIATTDTGSYTYGSTISVSATDITKQ